MLQQKAAISRRRRTGSGGFRHLTAIPNLFAGDGRVHRFEATEQERIEHFFGEGGRTSALICGDTETVLAQLPDCTFQSCVTSPPYWSLRDYSIPGQIGLEESVF